MTHHCINISLGYILSEDKQQILTLYHKRDINDESYGKYNGFSDFVTSNENTITNLKNNIYKQTQLYTKNFVFRGQIKILNFKKNKAPYLIHIFLCKIDKGTLKNMNEFGENRWINIDEFLNFSMPVWEGDKYFLPLVFDKNEKPFWGVLTYNNGIPNKWDFSR